MTKDWATCTFQTDSPINQIVYGHRVFHFPGGDDANLLIPVHAYLSSDHFDEKGAQMLTDAGDGDYRITSAYLDGRNPVDLRTGPHWQEGRITIDGDGVIDVWHNDPDDNWTKTGSTDVGQEDHFVEFDTMTEIQYDEQNDLPRTYKGQILTQWRWLRDTDGNWHRPDDVLSLQTGSNNDGDRSRIDWAVDQDDGRFYFYHHVH